MPAGDDHSWRPQLVDSLRHRTACSRARERLGFVEIRRHDGREREEPGHEGFDSIILEQLRAARCDHYGIDDERDWMVSEIVGHDLDQVSREEHSGLRGVDTDVVEDGLELSGDEVRRHLVHGGHAGRVLSRQRHDCAHSMAARGGKRLQVGLDPGAAAGIGPGNSQTTWNGQVRSLRRYEPDQVRRV